MSAPKLQTVAIRKVYPGTAALRDVSMGFDGGRVHALIGKNGAGKSTLVKILSGAVAPTSGAVLLDGQPVHLRSPRDAFEKGIATVYQELSLVPGLTVGENILMGRLPRRRVLGVAIVDWPEVFHRSEAVLRNLHVALDVRARVGRLGVAQQQLVEIAKAMSYSPAVLILDEPTSALAHHEVASLFGLLRTLARRGVAVLYITHRLQELSEIADTVSVLRDGEFVGTIGVEQATPELLVHMMFGETVPRVLPAALAASREPVLEVRHLGSRGRLHDISFTLHRGEILGLAGMLGSGRTELLERIFGAAPFDEGEILVEGQAVGRPTPAAMKRLGVGLTPENRKEAGLVQLLSTRENLCLASLDALAVHGVLWKGRERAVAERSVRELQIAVADVEQPVASLSGGNQQKVVVGNWLNTRPRIMLFDEPTRGIDVRAKQQVFQILWDLSRRGISSIFVSSELEELIEVCHRILIVKKGRIVGEVGSAGHPLEKLFELCMEA